MAFFPMLFFPFFCICGFLYLWVKNRRTGLLGSFLVAAGCMAISIWTIFQSRSSTAAVGLIFVPGYGSMCGFLTWAYFHNRSKSGPFAKIASYAYLAIAMGLVAYGIYVCINQSQRQAAKDHLEKETRDYGHWIVEQSQTNQPPGWLVDEIKRHAGDEAFKMAVARSEVADSQTLDSLADASDIQMLASVISNKNTQPATIDRIWATQANETRLDYAFAFNVYTSKKIIEIIYKRSPSVAYMLAKSPNTPKHIVLSIARTPDIYSLEALIAGPNVDCQVLDDVKKTLVDPKLSNYNHQREKIKFAIKEKSKKLCPAH